MSVRPATAADAGAIATIWNHYIHHSTVTFASVEKSVDGVAGLIATRPAFFVAEGPSGIAGFATYDQFRSGDGYARTMEHTVQLHPDCRGGGHGHALMAAIEDHAMGRGAHSIFAGVSAENAAGRAFHARRGYAEVAILPQAGWKFGRWIDLVLMQKILS